VPQGRNGHSLHLHDGFLIMFGGILGITEESDDIYMFQVSSGTWKLIDLSLGPFNILGEFKTENIQANEERKTRNAKLRETQSTPALNKDKDDDLDIKVVDNSLHSGAKTAQNKLKRNANSVPRMGGTSYTTRRGGSTKRNGEMLSTKNTFGIIPTLTTEMKQTHRNDYIKRLKLMQNKDEDADRFLKTQKGIEESPTSMKMKNTFILVNNNPSFDNYAAMMKKRKLG